MVILQMMRKKFKLNYRIVLKVMDMYKKILIGIFITILLVLVIIFIPKNNVSDSEVIKEYLEKIKYVTVLVMLVLI